MALTRLSSRLLSTIAALFLMLLSAAPHAELLRSHSWELGIPTSGHAEILDGLPQISALAIAKDRDGLLWVGTQNGLARFDGTQFQIFNSQNTKAISSSWVNALFLDSRGGLWIATTEEITRYTNHQFLRLTAPGADEDTTGFTETADGKVWLAGQTLRYAVDTTIKPADFYAGDAAEVLALGDALLIRNEDRQVFIYAQGQLTELAPSLWQHQTVLQMAQFRDQLLLLTDQAVFQLHRQNDQWQARDIPLPPESIPRILATSSEQILLLNLGGATFELQLAEPSPSWRAVRMPAPPTDNLDPKTAMLEPGPELWIGTQASGLWSVWSNGIEREAPDMAIAKVFAWSFFVDDTVYVATEDGVYRRENASNWTPYISPAAIENNVAYSYWQDSTGQYVGTRKGLYWRQNPREPFRQVDVLGNRQINSIIQENDTLLLPTSDGLYSRSDSDGRYQLIAGTASLAIRALVRDDDSNLWLGTESGVYIQQNGVVTPVDSPMLDSVFVTAMSEFGDGWLAVGSYGRGFFVRAPDGEWQRYTTNDGLPFSNIFSLTPIGDWLWSSSDKGMIRLDQIALKRGKIRANVVMRDDGAFRGRSRLRCCNGAGHRRAVIFDNKLFLPTLEGVLSVTMDRPPIEALPPIITGLWLGETWVPVSDALNLRKDQRDLEIAFTAPHLATGELPKFRYRLGSDDEEWVYTSGRRVAFFTNLPSGTSTFELQAKLGAADWLSAQPMNITVQPYFYETWFARTLLVMALIGLIWLVVRDRTHRLEQRAEQLEAAVATATRALEDTARDGQRLIQEANAPIVTLTEEGRILGWNRAAEKLTGYQFSEIAHQLIGDLFPDASPVLDARALFGRLARGDSIEGLRLSLSNRDGRRITLLMGGTLLPASRDVPARAVMVGQDLTDYLEREQQLVQASKMSTLGEMATGMAHELNQPLNIIKLTLINLKTIIERKPEKIDQAPVKLERIEEQVDRAAKIIDHMRRFGRRAEMPATTKHTDFDAQQAVESATSLFREQLSLDNIGLETHYDAASATVAGDPLLLEQVIMNLLSNARDAIKEHRTADQGRRILIETSLTNDHFVITVEDNGGGVSESTLTSMFEPFFTTKEPGKGTGLGLSISYSTIRSLSGEITAANTEAGLCVRIELPIQNAQNSSQITTEG